MCPYQSLFLSKLASDSIFCTITATIKCNRCDKCPLSENNSLMITTKIDKGEVLDYINIDSKRSKRNRLEFY